MRNSEPTVFARDLSRRFGARRALEEIDLTILPGESVSLFGPNGAGKTTLLRILSSLLRPTSGVLRLFGKDPRRDDWPKARLGYLTHRSFLYPHLTGKENLAFYGRLYGLEDLEGRIRERARELGIADRMNDPVRTYSSGMHRRLSIARALLHDPEFLLLDEPFSGVDPGGIRTLRSVLSRFREKGRTVLLATHHLEEGYALGDRLLILSSGRIVYSERKDRVSLGELQRMYGERSGSALLAGMTV